MTSHDPNMSQPVTVDVNRQNCGFTAVGFHSDVRRKDKDGRFGKSIEWLVSHRDPQVGFAESLGCQFLQVHRRLMFG